MEVSNKTKRTTLSEDAVEAKSLTQKTVGLTSFSNPHTLILSTRFGIHTFGMKFPIDVLILNTSNNVVAMKKNLTPNRLFLWNPKYATVIELPEGKIKASQTTIGDQIEMK
jgi:uncharacterized membrane protein (UPF0127 family)